MKKQAISRAVRNNNPFNIRISKIHAWLGRVPVSENTDGVYEQFKDIDHGMRAGIVLFRSYIKQGYDTPRLIVSYRYFGDRLQQHLFFLEGFFPDLNVKIRFRSAEFYKLCVAICLYESDVLYSVQNIKYICNLFHLTETYTKTF